MSEDLKTSAEIKVAALIDPLTIVINRGASDGISIGDRFLVYALGNEILDPDSGKSLGLLEVVKGTGKAVHVQMTMTTISSDMKSAASRTVRKSMRNPSLRALAMGMVHDVEEEVLPSERVPFERVKVGDTVRKMRD